MNGYVRVPIREELVSVCRAGGSCPEVPKVLLQVRVSVAKRVEVDVEVVFTPEKEG